MFSDDFHKGTFGFSGLKQREEILEVFEFSCVRSAIVVFRWNLLLCPKHKKCSCIVLEFKVVDPINIFNYSRLFLFLDGDFRIPARRKTFSSLGEIPPSLGTTAIMRPFVRAWSISPLLVRWSPNWLAVAASSAESCSQTLRPQRSHTELPVESSTSASSVEMENIDDGLTSSSHYRNCSSTRLWPLSGFCGVAKKHARAMWLMTAFQMRSRTAHHNSFNPRATRLWNSLPLAAFEASCPRKELQ